MWLRIPFPPSLLFFNLNIDSATLTLQFSEPIALPTIRVQSFTFVSDTGLRGPSVTLDTSTVSSSEENSSFIMIDLSRNDMNNIKFERELAPQLSTTHTSLMVTDAVRDLAGNSIQAVPPPGTRVNIFTGDTAGPVLEEFTFNLNTGLLTMTFNEVIDVFTTRTSAFVLINAPSGLQSVRLNGGMVASDNFTVLYITLTTEQT